MRGWVVFDRDFTRSDLWLSESFTRGQAWVDLFANANHKPGYFRVTGHRIDLERGQIGWSQLTMAARWKWSRGKVKRFLNELEKDSQIVQVTGQYTTVLTICNYSKYQEPKPDSSTIDGTTNDTVAVQSTDTKRDTNNNDNNDNKKKHKRKFSDSDLRSAQLMYEKLLEIYPLIKKPNFNTWADDIRKMRKLDGRAPELIAKVFAFAAKHHFWSKNILSPGKLREKFDRLLAEITPSKGGTSEAAAAWEDLISQLHDSRNAKLSNRVVSTLASMGGLRLLAQCNEKDLPFKRKEFMEHWQ